MTDNVFTIIKETFAVFGPDKFLLTKPLSPKSITALVSSNDSSFLWFLQDGLSSKYVSATDKVMINNYYSHEWRK